MNYRLSRKGDKKGDEKATKKGDEIAERVERVFTAISENPLITVDALSEKISATKKQTENAIKILKNSGRIHREGASRGGHWVVD